MRSTPGSICFVDRGLDGEKVVREFDAWVSRIATRRRLALRDARNGARKPRRPVDSAQYELVLCLEWHALTYLAVLLYRVYNLIVLSDCD